MRPIFKIIDQDTGEVLHSGLVTSWSMSRESGFTPYLGVNAAIEDYVFRPTTKFSFEGVEAIIPEEEPIAPQEMQEVISELVKALTPGIYKTASGQLVGGAALQIEPLTFTLTCAHEWQKYEGFTKTYDYCTKCDEKR
jgi:hypothetical protein